MIGRRQFIAGLGSAAAWPLASRAQQGDRVRRIGVLIGGDENDPVYKGIPSALTQGLEDLGWADGRNVRIDLRQFGDDINRSRALAQELVGLQPDILTSNTPATAALQNAGDPDLWLSATRSAAGSLRASYPWRDYHRLHPHRSTRARPVPVATQGPQRPPKRSSDAQNRPSSSRSVIPVLE